MASNKVSIKKIKQVEDIINSHKVISKTVGNQTLHELLSLYNFVKKNFGIETKSHTIFINNKLRKIGKLHVKRQAGMTESQYEKLAKDWARANYFYSSIPGEEGLWICNRLATFIALDEIKRANRNLTNRKGKKKMPKAIPVKPVSKSRGSIHNSKTENTNSKTHNSLKLFHLPKNLVSKAEKLIDLEIVLKEADLFNKLQENLNPGQKEEFLNKLIGLSSLSISTPRKVTSSTKNSKPATKVKEEKKELKILSEVPVGDKTSTTSAYSETFRVKNTLFNPSIKGTKEGNYHERTRSCHVIKTNIDKKLVKDVDTNPSNFYTFDALAKAIHPTEAGKAVGTRKLLNTLIQLDALHLGPKENFTIKCNVLREEVVLKSYKIVDAFKPSPKSLLSTKFSRYLCSLEQVPEGNIGMMYLSCGWRVHKSILSVLGIPHDLGRLSTHSSSREIPECVKTFRMSH